MFLAPTSDSPKNPGFKRLMSKSIVKWNVFLLLMGNKTGCLGQQHFRKCALNITYGTGCPRIGGVQLYDKYGFGTAMLRLIMPESMLYIYCNRGASVAADRRRMLGICSGHCTGIVWRPYSNSSAGRPFPDNT
jgi:hypothetical protein